MKELCLKEIDEFLHPNGKSLADYDCMPKINSSAYNRFDNLLMVNELSYDCDDMLVQHNQCFSSLNPEKLAAYELIVRAVNDDLGRMFFVDGYGGTGKTYLWKSLSFRFRSEGKIVLNVASSGIASILLPGGRTAHSQFSIPLDIYEESCCRIEKNSKKASLLIMTTLIIWDEAPMVNRWAFEAFDRTLWDVISSVDDSYRDIPFGGKTIVFCGDFRQILPVVPRGSRADIVHATINSSPLWRYCKVLKLTTNMRLQYSDVAADNELLKRFAEWILDLGDGKLGVDNDGEAMVEIPDDLCIQHTGGHMADIVLFTYPSLMENLQNADFFQDRAILAPTLDLVEKVNDYVISMIPHEGKEYFSCNTICKVDEDVGIDRRWITTEFLNGIKCYGIPNHRYISR